MKGIVFTELIEMVEAEFGLEAADHIICSVQSRSNGAYTAVGTYDHMELIGLIVALSKHTETPVPVLVRHFGRYLFSRFVELYPQFFAGIDSALTFLPSIESFIHVEVRKLYPDAELPRFRFNQTGDSLEVTYQSNRPFADLAEGLIAASLDHFGDRASLSRTDIGESNGTEAQFVVTPFTVTDPRASQTCPN
ncbi:heme NO-binding domain-containing protein [Rhodopirellula sp. MGV]|uniref:heme NO-binding domain-containing protein n=1 Tax=Rhodopirellula sp. MGV TaxID=2023130 RepID=UPI000B972B92|nr:heme NO-binding domain-containing protein [Rhodopirellula sp. MGV]OYP38243.1 hypothetical protein CGZ80_03225 [Rhodopirellula sp. MGV]PNY38580.1 hypothetical protein C2E31_01280 [Rhodopirellula baltica]